MADTSICSWCRKEYTGSGHYHVCDDGTTYPIRSSKSFKEIKDEHDRQDRIKLGYEQMGGPEPTVKLYDMSWTPYDILFLKGCKIKL